MEKYSYQKVLGMGNFGKAWLVRSRESRRPYVIKEVNVVCMGEMERERAVNEVAILGRLRHMNIIRYREAFVAGGGGILVIVMEYGDGGDLAKKIEETKQSRESFSGPHILNWFVQLCLALCYMHSEKILHRDLKPSNIFLTSKGLIKVGDFGIAKMLHNTLDHASTAIGTPYYLSPEICQQQPYNQKSDMWAAGCILYELVTLTRPFEGHELSTLIMRILRGIYTPIPSSYGIEIEELVAVLLSVSPDMRPSAHAILTSPNIRPFVKAFTDQKDLFVGSPSPSSERSCKTQPKKSQGDDPLHSAFMHSPYAITPGSSRNNNASRRVRRFHRPEQSAVKPREQRRHLKPRTDSPMINDSIDFKASKRISGVKPIIIHHHSASEPTHVGDKRTPSHYTSKPKRATSQRKSSKKLPSSAAPCERRLHDSVSKNGGQQLPSRTPRRYVSASNKVQTPSSISRKRKAYLPEVGANVFEALHHPSDGSSESSTKKRRQSLPERVKDSKILSRLVSTDSKTSKRLKPRTMEKNVPNTETQQRPRKSKTPRRKNEPSYDKIDEAREVLSPASTEKTEVRKLPRTAPATKTYQRPRLGSNAPITCLFPKAPKTSSSRPRTRVKHGTYTLNLPNVSAGDQQAPSKCDQCKCRQGRRMSSRSNSVADVLPSHTIQTPAKRKREMNDGNVIDAASFSETSCHFDSPSSPSVGNFRRRNALRRRSRDYVQMKRDLRGIRDDRHGNDVQFNRLGDKPDVIPPIEDEVFLQAVEPEQEQGVYSGRTLTHTRNAAMDQRQDLEIAEFLHAGMEKPGEATSDLRAKLEVLKMYLERRLGVERSSVAFNILSSASYCKTQRTSGVSNGTSEDVVRLVADVLGAGKMSYFPVLLKVVSLSNQCH